MISKTRYELTNENISICVAEADTLLSRYKLEKGDKFRLLLSMEEVLVNLVHHKGASETGFFKLIMQKRLNHITITVRLQGAAFNPFEHADDDDENSDDSDGLSQISISHTLLKNLGCTTHYNYENGRNKILFFIETKKSNPTILMLSAMAAALLCGVAANFLLTASQTTVLQAAVGATSKSIFGLLGAVVNPFVFFSILGGIIDIGNIYTVKQVASKLVKSFLLLNLLGIVHAMVFGYLFYPPIKAPTQGSGVNIGNAITILLDIIPKSIVEPFSTGSTLQIVFLAVFIGAVLLVAKEKLPNLSQLIRELGILVEALLGAMCKFLPILVFVTLLNFFLQDKSLPLSGLFYYGLLMVVSRLSIGFIEIMILSVRHKIKVVPRLKKFMPTLIIAATTATSSATYLEHYKCCTTELGIEPNIAGFAIPIGSIMCSPGKIGQYYFAVLFAATAYSIPLSGFTLLLIVLVSTVFAMASPPVPTAGIFIYALLFANFGIPTEIISIMIAVDFILDSFFTISNVSSVNVGILMGVSNLHKQSKAK